MNDIHSIQFVHQNNELKTKIKRKHYLVVLIEKLTYSNGILFHYANNVIYQFVGIHLLRICQIKLFVVIRKIVNQKKVERRKNLVRKETCLFYTMQIRTVQLFAYIFLSVSYCKWSQHILPDLSCYFYVV